MANSFAADGVQYGRDSSFYETAGANNLLPGNLEIVGNLLVDGSTTLVGVVTTGAGINTAGGVTVGTILANAPLVVHGTSSLAGAVTTGASVQTTGAVTVGTLAANASLVVNGGATVGDGTHASNLTVNGGATVTGSVVCGDLATTNGNIHLNNGTINFVSNGIGGLTIQNGATIPVLTPVTVGSLTSSSGVSAATLSVGAPSAQGTITYINANITYSGTTHYNVGIPVNYPALITLTSSLAVGTGYLSAVFCTVNTNPNSWGLREITNGANGVQYFSVNPDTPAGTQLQVSVPGGGAGTIYTSYKIERSGV